MKKRRLEGICPRCGLRKKANKQDYCLECRADAGKRYRQRPEVSERLKALCRVKSARRTLRSRSDPEYREKLNASQRKTKKAWRDKNPEKVILLRQQKRDGHARRMKMPGYAEALAEKKREYYAKLKEMDPVKWSRIFIYSNYDLKRRAAMLAIKMLEQGGSNDI